MKLYFRYPRKQKVKTKVQVPPQSPGKKPCTDMTTKTYPPLIVSRYSISSPLQTLADIHLLGMRRKRSNCLGDVLTATAVSTCPLSKLKETTTHKQWLILIQQYKFRVRKKYYAIHIWVPTADLSLRSLQADNGRTDIFFNKREVLWSQRGWGVIPLSATTICT